MKFTRLYMQKGNAMKKIINKPDHIIHEMLEGFVGAYHKQYERHPNVNGVLLKRRRKNKVALVIGGGSGHEPMFSGFVGQGLADAAACGNIFASPDPRTIYKIGKSVNSGQGILFVYGCYAGDNLNFDMAEEFLNKEGIQTAHVRVWDDVASAPQDRIEDRRGIAGDVFVIKVAGAACDAGLELNEVRRITEKARDNTRSIGVATAPGQIPGLEQTTFELGEDEIEYGMGLHGEPGILRTIMKPADELAETLYASIKEDSDLKMGDEVCVLINGLGATTILELSIVYRKVQELLKKDGVQIHDSDINNYCTCQEMGGFSITIMKLDDELKRYYNAPCYCPYYSKMMVEEVEEELEHDVKDVEECSENYKIEPFERIGILDTINAEEAKQMLLHIANKIIMKKPYLTEVDSKIGDGDHGIGMEGGMRKVITALRNIKEAKNVYEIFEIAGTEMLMSMGGASGVIFGSLYLSGAKGMQPKTELTQADIATMLRKSLNEIKSRGKAKVGDKTMVDALEPAVVAMEANEGLTLLEMMREAEDASKVGVENTKLYIAKFGRAKSLMERAIGYQDAGATSVALIIEGMREYIEGGEAYENCYRM